MSDDRPLNEGDDLPSNRSRFATVGRSQAEKRRALGNIPSWETISGMNLELPETEATKDDTTRTTKRFTVAIPPSKEPSVAATYNYEIPIPRAVASPIAKRNCLDPLLTPLPTSSAPEPNLRPSSSVVSSSSSSSPKPSTGRVSSGPSGTQGVSASSSASSSTSKTTLTYGDYLAESKTKDFSSLQQAGFAYQSGVDFAGRPVLVICGAIPPSFTPDELVLYIINLMDPITEGDYSVVYVVMSEGHKPGFGWFRKVYGTITRKYKKNLKQLFIVHPSMWVKLGFQFFRPFVSTKFWKKLVYINEVHELYKFMSPSQIRFPNYVIQQAGFLKNSNAMFGQQLQLAMGHVMNQHLLVPYLVQSAIDTIRKRGLTTEGIFRVGGSIVRIKELQEMYDKGIPVDLSKEPDIHAVTGLLKRYLRELPEPIIPFSMYSDLVHISGEQIPLDLKCAFIQAQLCELDPTCFFILNQLIQLLVEISSLSAQNKMSPSNLAIVIAPNIMYNEKTPTDPLVALSEPGAVISLVTLLITHADTLLGNARIKFDVASLTASGVRDSLSNASSSTSSSDAPKNSKNSLSTPTPPPQALFGRSLQEAMSLPMNTGYLIPVLVQSAIDAVIANGLHVEGIMRLSGSKNQIDELQQRFDAGEVVDLMELDDVHVATGLLKRYLVQLPDPVIPFSLYTTMLSIITENQAESLRLGGIQHFLCELPPTNFLIFNHIIQLMVKIAAFEADTRMNAHSLAIVLAPNILRPQHTPTDQTQLLSEMSVANTLLELIIQNADIVLSDAREQVSPPKSRASTARR